MRRRDLLRATLAPGTVGLAGCGYRAGAGDPRWSYSLRGGVTAIRAPATGRRPLLVAGRGEVNFGAPGVTFPSGEVAALDPATGERRWSHTFGVQLSAVGRRLPTGDRPVPVGMDSGTVGLLHPAAEGGDGEGTDAAAAESGTWTDGTATRAERLAEFDDRVTAVVTDGRLTYVGVGGTVAAVGPGEPVRWRVSDLGAAGKRDHLVPTRAGVLVAGSGRLTALDRGGEERWRLTDTAVGAPLAAPVPDADGLLVTCSDGLVALGPDGSERWHADLGGSQGLPPAVAGDTVYAASGRALAALDRTDGTRRWRYRHPDAGLAEGLAAVPGRAFVRQGDGTVAAVADGERRWRAPLPVEDRGAPAERPFHAVGQSLVVPGAESVAAVWRPQTDPDPFPYL